MNEAKKRQHGTRPGEQSGPLEFSVDDESGDGAEDQSGEHGAAAEQRHPVIDHPGRAELGHADLLG